MGCQGEGWEEEVWGLGRDARRDWRGERGIGGDMSAKKGRDAG